MDDLDGLISAWATSWVGTKGVSIVLSYLFSALRTPVFGSRREAGRSECAISRLRQENPDRWNGRLWRARVIGVRTMERVSDVAREHVEDLCPAERRCARALLADYPGSGLVAASTLAKAAGTSTPCSASSPGSAATVQQRVALAEELTSSVRASHPPSAVCPLHTPGSAPGEQLPWQAICQTIEHACRTTVWQLHSAR